MKNPFSIRLIISVVLSLIGAPVWAQYNHCVSVYQTATRNLQISEASYSSINTIFDDYCETSGESKSSNSSAGIEAVIKQIPIKFSGKKGKSKQRMKNFCKSYSNVRNDTAASRELANTVVVDALKSFNECIAITQAGIKIIHNAPTGLEGTFSFQFGNNLEYELQGVQTGQNIECSMQSPNDSELIKLDKSSAYLMKTNFSAFCNRIPLENNEKERQSYPRTNVTFASNHGSYSVIYPEEEIEGVQFASMIDRRVSAVESRLSQLSKTMVDNKASLMNLIDKKASDAEKNLTAFINRLNVKIFKVMRGEHHANAHPNWTTVGCGDINSYLQSQCPNQTITQTQVFQRRGNKCGYTYVVAACITK